MKKWLSYGIFALFCCAIGVVWGRHIQRVKTRPSDTKPFHPTATLDQTPEKERPFVIISPSWNNADYCEEHLASIFSQNYSNYRLIYIDDASTDGTGERVRGIIDRYGMRDRVTLIENSAQQGAVANLYSTIQMCSPDDIVVIVDGDDALAHEEVLTHLNTYYSDEDVWMTFGQFIFTPSYEKGWCRPYDAQLVSKGGFRRHPFWASHLRTFYADLFHRLPIDSLIHEGKWLPRAYDIAIMLPLLEMCGKHAYYVDEVLYRYRFNNPKSDHVIAHDEQLACEEAIRSRAPFPPLESREAPSRDEGAAILLFSCDRPMQLYALLESIEANVKGDSGVYVIGRATTDAYAKGYQHVAERFPHVSFIMQQAEDGSDFRPLVLDTLERKIDVSHIVFGVDDIIVTAPIDLAQGMASLAKTGAYGLYYRLGKNTTYCYMAKEEQGVPPLIELGDSLYAWQFSAGKCDWDYPNTVDFTLFRKRDVLADLSLIPFNTPGWLEARWSGLASHDRVGLVYERSSIVNIPLNVINDQFGNAHMASHTAETLHQAFMSGKKIDITPLQGIAPLSAHSEYEIVFVPK
jgi:hypothetical protein